jgi:TrmH family RNA methyltransferase
VSDRRFPPATRAQVADLVALRTPQDRRAAGRCLVEGATLLGEALDAGLRPALVAVGQDLPETAEAVVLRAQAAGAPIVALDRRAAERLSDREHAPGLLAAVPLPEPWSGRLPAGGPALLLALCGLQDPGNVGTLLRAARAFGATACLVTAGSADPFGPKVVRASAGAAFRLPVQAAEPDAIAELARTHALQLAAAVHPRALSAGVPGAAGPVAFALPERCILLLGHETRGVPPLPGSLPVTVPHEPVVESLNVAVAGSILLADWYRARRR